MSVPKKQRTSSSARRRRSHHSLSSRTLVSCSNCGKKRTPHKVCSHCGYYRGVKHVSVRKKTTPTNNKK